MDGSVSIGWGASSAATVVSGIVAGIGADVTGADATSIHFFLCLLLLSDDHRSIGARHPALQEGVDGYVDVLRLKVEEIDRQQNFQYLKSDFVLACDNLFLRECKQRGFDF